MQTPPPLPRDSTPGWWERNWKWFVPILCLAGALVIGAFVTSIFALMKSSDAYIGAVARAKADPSVNGALGTPIKEGFLVTGNINVSGASGKADLAIPIEGPKGNATIFVAAHKIAGQWRFDRLIVQLSPDGRRIDLSDR